MRLFTRAHIVILSGIGAVVLLAALFFTCVIPGLKHCKQAPTSKEPPKQAVGLWGVLHRQDFFSSQLNTGFPVTYKNFELGLYESELLGALAAGRGPDVFMIHSSWLPKFADKLMPLESNAFGVAELRQRFPRVVEQDFTAGGKIYALPLYLDTLALFYNQEMFDDAGIVFPPRTWSELLEMVPLLRRVDAGGGIEQAAAALGGSERSVNRATDILSLLMLQSGVEMVDAKLNRATFAAKGLTPFNFYLQFADPANPYYTWHDALPNSLDLFAEEKVAMMFNYYHQASLLKEKAPFLRYRIAAMPEPVGAERSLSYGSYWGLAVSRQSRNPRNAWRFILSLTADPASAKRYLELTDRPAALLVHINERLRDPAWEVFARQALTARSWFQVESALVERALSGAIQAVLSGRERADRALSGAAGEISDALRKRGAAIRTIYFGRAE